MSSAFFSAPRPAVIRADARACTLVVDAEESFDWVTPVRGTAYTTTCMRNISELHGIIGAYGIVPAYLLTYPLLEDADVVRNLRVQVEKGNCLLGVQLHPWVTPPFDEDIGARFSYSGNLRSDLEELKLIALKSKFSECFGYDPLIYRSGRYGLSGQTAWLLEKHGFLIDTSLAPRTTFDAEGGARYNKHRLWAVLVWRAAQSARVAAVPQYRGLGWMGRRGALPYVEHGLGGAQSHPRRSQPGPLRRANHALPRGK